MSSVAEVPIDDAPSRPHASATVQALGDFVTDARLLPLCGLAIGIGVVSAFVAFALLRLIGLFTNLFFFQRWGTDLISPAAHQLGWLVVLVPVVGALIIGFMARFGSERIRGHGIPEAIEAILISGSRVDPKVAVLKPLSSAISIGSGGPFGAEGQIIMTGGAIGSLFAQFLHLSSMERKTLLVAGASGGMSATFNAPIAAALLAVELLLFEWRPRSLIPVALASATAAAVRSYLLGGGPLFPTPPHTADPGLVGLAACLLVGVLAGGLSALLTLAVYTAEDGFSHLPFHWMWWPAIGGLVIGIGGLIFPQALGVGYDTLGALLQGNVAANVIVGVLLVKSVIWAVALGSGTSGRGQRLYPVVERDDVLVGVVAASELELALSETGAGAGDRPLADLVRREPVVAHPDEPLRAVVYRMARTGVTRMPVVAQLGVPTTLAGMIGLRDMLKARVRSLEDEQNREQVLRLHRLVPARARRLIPVRRR